MAFSQNRHSSYQPSSQFKPKSTQEYSNTLQQVQNAHDKNEDYLYALESWILELKTQIQIEKFQIKLNVPYEKLIEMEDGALAYASSDLKKIEMEIKQIVSEYNQFANSYNSNAPSSTTITKDAKDIAIEYHQKGDFANAIYNYSKYLEDNPNNSDVIFLRGWAKSEVGDLYGAIKDYDKIILIHSDYPLRQSADLATVYNNKAYALMKLGESQQALSLVNNALQLNKSHDFIWDTKGEISFSLGNYQDCIDAMSKAIALNESGHSLYFRGLAFLKINQKDKACIDLSRAGELGIKEAYNAIADNCR